MYKYLTQGLLLGLAYVAPIGMQNLYVINTALSGNKKRTYQVALFTIFFDILLALACFFGIGILLKNIPSLKSSILLIGSILVVLIGLKLIREAGEIDNSIEKRNNSLFQIFLTCFVVTWLNPQAIIDGSLLLGGYHVSLPPNTAIYFIFGFCTASFLWFTSISSITLFFNDKLNEKVIKIYFDCIYSSCHNWQWRSVIHN
mgnify:CR=1 FL=1